MGNSSYNFNSRSARTVNFMSQSFDDTFEQQRKGRMHEDMDPKKALIRESRDSEANPITTPIMLGLDITGSMQDIPKDLIGEGLPKMVSAMNERKVPGPAILFMGLGDSKCDRYPFQVGQFESGDAELDLWLTRTYIEGNGGGNNGESYLWAWYFAANRTVTDSWEKRKQKGFLFTVGNEPCHPEITSSEFRQVLGDGDHKTESMQDLYKAASEKWDIYHLCIDNRKDSCPTWKEFLGDHAIEVKNYKDIPNIIANTIARSVPSSSVTDIGTSPMPPTKITL